MVCLWGPSWSNYRIVDMILCFLRRTQTAATLSSNLSNCSRVASSCHLDACKLRSLVFFENNSRPTSATSRPWRRGGLGLELQLRGTGSKTAKSGGNDVVVTPKCLKPSHFISNCTADFSCVQVNPFVCHDWISFNSVDQMASLRQLSLSRARVQEYTINSSCDELMAFVQRYQSSSGSGELIGVTDSSVSLTARTRAQHAQERLSFRV